MQLASFDAWIKLYRPNENSSNTAISYYTKGDVIAFLLDARIRKATRDRKNLDDVMRLAYERYSGPHGYTPEQFRQLASEVAGQDLDGWFHKVLETTEELDYTEALDWFGLRFKEKQDAGKDEPPPIETGLKTQADDGRLVVSEVRRGSPGEKAGVNVGDEILAVNQYRVRADQWPVRLDSYKAGDKLTLLVARRDLLKKLEMELMAVSRTSWTLEVLPGASEEQQAHLKSWLREE